MKYFIKYTFLMLIFAAGNTRLAAQAKQQPDTVTIKKPEKVNVLFGAQEYDRFVGNMSSVSGEKLKNYPSMMVQESLAGQLPGLFLMQNNGNPGEDNFTGFVRGSVGGYVTLVDGVERPLRPYDLEQIDEIKLLKDPVSKALYGGRMTNGILLVTTKRGKTMNSEFHAGVQRGVKMPTVLPKYLNSFDFATNYNKALANDGITTGVYSQAALDAYKNHTNPYQYPDVDFYGQFLNKSMDITRVSTEYYGGNESTKFYAHGGYQNEGGLEAYGARKRKNQTYNLQGNVDSKFSDAITLHANFAGYMANKQYPGSYSNTPNADGSTTNGTYLLYTLASRYPNAYPILVAPDSAGGTASFKDNPYAGESQSGYYLENHLRMQTDLSFDIKLDKLVKGLTFKPAYSFDIFHQQNLVKANTIGVYGIATYNLDGTPATLNILQPQVKATNQTLGINNYGRRWAFNGTLAYETKIGKSAINADVVYYMAKLVNSGTLLDYRRQNLGVRLNYTYNGKYTLEGVLTYAGSESYSPNRRFKTFPALGAGWVVSKENFMKDASFIDYLKLNASWGIMGDGNIAVNQWRESWGASANYNFSTATTAFTTVLNQVQSSMLNWPKQREVDISLEANMFKKIGFKLSYFNYLQSDWLSQGANNLPAIIGSSNFLPFLNFGKTGLKGVEAELSYKGNAGKLQYEIGTHLTYSKSNKVLVDELPDPNFKTQGTPWDAVWGYQTNGTYTQAEIDQIDAGTSSLPKPSYMDPTSLRAGNIKYKDLNNDGKIDRYDTRIIGNNMPRLMYGGDVKLAYGGFSLYVMLLGYGQYKHLLNNSYYQVFSTRKYSNVVTNGLPNGNPQPQLTTGTATNDFQTSDYWIVNGGFLKIKDVALSYSLPANMLKRMRMSDLKLTLYGTNLACFSKIKDTDPESINAGLSEYPLFRSLAVGLTATF